MKKILKLFVFLLAGMCTTTTYCNIIWPAIFVTQAIFNSILFVSISLVIEALFFYWLIKNISFAKSFLMSFIGNLASTGVGTILMALFMFLWHIVVEGLLGVGTFSIVNFIATFLFMYIGSVLIELILLRIIFNYSFKQLATPVFIGNAITYALVYGLKLLPQLKM